MEAYLLNYSVEKFYSKEKLPKFCIAAVAMELHVFSITERQLVENAIAIGGKHITSDF